MSRRTSVEKGGSAGDPGSLLDLQPLGRRLFWVAVALAAAAVAGAVVEGLLSGLTFGVLVVWGARWAAAVVVAAALVVATSAVRGARRARRRGERLTSDDVGVAPPRPQVPHRGRPGEPRSRS